MKEPIVWITLANVIYLASYSVRDILWLRILTVAGSALLIPYYALQRPPLTTAIEWSLVFIAINVYWIVRLMIERRPVHLTPDEERLRQLSFPSLTLRDARNLFDTGRWDDISAKTSLVAHDLMENEFSVILRGNADLIYRGAKVEELGEGQFVGAVDLWADAVGDMDVLVVTAVRAMCWPRSGLQAFLKKRPDVALALERSVGYQTQKLLGDTLSKFVEAPQSSTPTVRSES